MNPAKLSPCMCFSLQCHLSMCRQELLTQPQQPQGVFLPDPALIIFHYTWLWDNLCKPLYTERISSESDRPGLFCRISFSINPEFKTFSLTSEGVNSAGVVQGLCFPKSQTSTGFTPSANSSESWHFSALFVQPDVNNVCFCPLY